jgi:hypothetical protein
LQCVAVREGKPIIFLRIRRRIESDDDLDTPARAQKGVYGNIVGHSGIHELDILAFVDAVRCGLGQFALHSICEIRDRGRIDGVHLAQVLIPLRYHVVNATEACQASEDRSYLLIVVAQRSAESAAEYCQQEWHPYLWQVEAALGGQVDAVFESPAHGPRGDSRRELLTEELVRRDFEPLKPVLLLRLLFRFLAH